MSEYQQYQDASLMRRRHRVPDPAWGLDFQSATRMIPGVEGESEHPLTRARHV